VGRRLTIILALGAVTSALASPGAADAAATIGSLLTKAPEESSCGPNSTFANVAVAAPAMLKAPYDGVVVRWRMSLQAPGGAYEYKLRIVEPPPSGNTYKFVASGPPQKAPSAGVNVLALPQPLPIKAGDMIAIDCPYNAPSPFTDTGFSGTTFAYFTPVPADGTSASTNNQLGSEEELFNADIVGVPSLTGAAPVGSLPVGSPPPSNFPPATVGARGGDTVDIFGKHLADLTSVSIGGVAATAVTPLSETEATLRVPAHSPGKVEATATNAAGTSQPLADAFEFLGPPNIAGFKQKRRKWKRKAGTSFSFQLSEAGAVKLTFRKGGPKGWLSLRANAGPNTVRFKGKLSNGKKLKPGAYAVRLTATNGVEESATSSPLRFKIVK
jgi:hypothetical protein